MKIVETYYSATRQDVLIRVPSSIKTILDVGCGEGAFLKTVQEKTNAQTWGIEPEAGVAKKAEKNADTILVGTIEDHIDKLPDSYFDCITFNDVLEHLLEPTEILKMIKPKLSGNGILIASIPNVRFILNLKELIVQKEWEYKDFGILDSTHFRFFTKKSMIRMFKQAGFEVFDIKGTNEINSWKFNLLNIMTFGFFEDTKFVQFICQASSS